MNETQLPLILTAITGLLLLWRVTVMTGFLPVKEMLHLYRESFGVLRRHWWILLVYLAGHGATLLVTESQQAVAVHANRQLLASQFHFMGEREIPWNAILRFAGRRSLLATSTCIWAAPCRGVGLWLAGVLLVAYRRRILPQVLPPNRRLNWLLWGGAVATWAWIVIQFVFALGAYHFPSNPSALIFQALALLISAFWVVAGTYLACSMVGVARQANITDHGSPVQLLEVNFAGFCRLLKFFVFVTVITDLIPALVIMTIQLLTADFHVNSWLRAFPSIYAIAGQAFRILVFPAILFIVLEQAEWQPALRQTAKLWQHHAGEWLALLLPVFTLAFAVNVLRRYMLIYSSPISVGVTAVDIFVTAIDALASAWWLVTVVRWWNFTRTRAGQ